MILIDTSAILPVLDKNDVIHYQAAEIWRELIEEKKEIWINNYILLEATTLIQRRYGMEIVRNFQQRMVPIFQIEWIDAIKHTQAIEILLSTNRRKLSLVDISAFATMRRLGIRKVFTFDQHFAEQGFEVLL